MDLSLLFFGSVDDPDPLQGILDGSQSSHVVERELGLHGSLLLRL